MFGKKQSEEEKAKHRLAIIKMIEDGRFNGFRNGHSPWNINKKMTTEHCLKLSKAHLGKSPWNKGKIGVMPKYWLGKKRDSETNQKIRLTLQKKFLDIDYKQNAIRKLMLGMQIKPNKPETFLINLFKEKKLPYKYVGDGEVLFGGKNPDFINVNGLKLIIEVFGNYWHQGEDAQGRIDIFSKFGYRTLVIWETELKDIVSIVRRIGAFVKDEK
jgi:G:T-mismatch repair DNA endonuclease (very short patch repair protein)